MPFWLTCALWFVGGVVVCFVVLYVVLLRGIYMVFGRMFG